MEGKESVQIAEEEAVPVPTSCDTQTTKTTQDSYIEPAQVALPFSESEEDDVETAPAHEGSEDCACLSPTDAPELTCAAHAYREPGKHWGFLLRSWCLGLGALFVYSSVNPLGGLDEDMDSNEAFYEQLRLQQLYESRKTEDGQDPFIYKDPSDGTEYEWDLEKKAWFPKISEDFLAMYHANYGYNPPEIPEPSQPPKKVEEKPKTDPKPQPEQTEQKSKGEKRKADPGWFNVEDERNTNVYVTGLPPDITQDEFIETMSKYGIIMRDPVSEDFKVKLYKDKEGNLKGDGLCCYLKKESVQLALRLLDEYEIRGYKLHVESATFQLKGAYDATKKKKKCKDYKKKLSLQKKQLDWRPEKKIETRKRFERVIIIRNMFHPKDFEEDPLVLNEIREDLRSECEKFGQVKKILIYDRHPDGVASVSFKEAEEGDACILALNGRWFGGRQLDVQTWDGVTDYQVEETSREREERLQGWENFLQVDQKTKPADVSDEKSAPVNNGQSENKEDIRTEPAHDTDSIQQQPQPGCPEAKLVDDDAATTDSSIGNSDDEDGEEQS
ncbi:HIV Tat-specific factor 1 [Hyla sarda]|uniref:HIV Tat-specific factor 1 n=1 Tax=Hyla sarda TaxID=327740 RepID=UPI0024C45754|nr:HIV Tat-specific factor 1 [Hyla sarda]